MFRSNYRVNFMQILAFTSMREGPLDTGTDYTRNLLLPATFMKTQSEYGIRKCLSVIGDYQNDLTFMDIPLLVVCSETVLQR
ncbi:hypothetical protein ABIC60_004159 [Phyllobacterium ifriqiyense]